jgi:hypothetical protein
MGLFFGEGWTKLNDVGRSIMDLFCDDVFLPTGHSVCYTVTHSGEPYITTIYKAVLLSFGVRVALARGFDVISVPCLICLQKHWAPAEICDKCGTSVRGEVREHATRVMLVGELPVCRDIAGAIVAAYCASLC